MSTTDVIEFADRVEGSRIVIEGQTSATTRYRWSFETIAAKAFEWEGRTAARPGGWADDFGPPSVSARAQGS
jgi:hypothetical protein